ncbi:MAG: hypothetical protein M1817_004449 [Caeruleum heppii]|nr:MAG: hypothetical protein M1817_004449 [Caeruleum heppii]
MLGLDSYSSSDEEHYAGSSTEQDIARAAVTAISQGQPVSQSHPRNGTPDGDTPLQNRYEPPQDAGSDTASRLAEIAVDEPMVGPSGPPRSPSPSNGATSQPQSPYSSSRALIRDLTLPPVPNLDIPPSPPGSPPAATSAKFANFLELKKKGVHFNEKLAKSSALKNPSLLQKLMAFADMDEQAQYATTLPKDVWDPTAFPEWAYKEGLAKKQQEVLKQREEERAKSQRDALDFVPATASGDSSRGGTPGTSGTGRGSGRSAAERIMAGLDREKTRSPHTSDAGKRREVDRRGSRFDSYRSRDRSRSRSRDRRRRSRSR